MAKETPVKKKKKTQSFHYQITPPQVCRKFYLLVIARVLHVLACETTRNEKETLIYAIDN